MQKVIEKQRHFFNSDATKSVEFRRLMLNKLRDAIISNEDLIYKALKLDLNKSETEAYLTEIQTVLGEIKVALKNIKKWQKPTRVRTPITHFPSSSYVYSEPYGVVLILSPWNYPFQLALSPLVGAIATGNCAILKVSKSSVNVSNAIDKIISETFDEDYIYCTGDRYSYDEILNQKYDFIFFTGSENVGKIVMEAASKNVTPLVLELGGKSPCIIDKSANIDLAAKRIVWGKYLNSGQTCVAPDYVLIDQSVKEEFIKSAQKHITLMYNNALQNEDYPKIINQHHFDRLTGLIANETNKIGGKFDGKKRKIEPTMFITAGFEDAIMKDEIFGPILPIISYAKIDDVIATLKNKPKPLALYLFSENHELVEKVLNGVAFGGGCVNDVIMHLANHHLPFGGVGSSGMGSYHGKFSFDLFSHKKGILKNKSYFDIPLRYPPYNQKKLNLLKKVTK
ncbi:MAG: aldehyde dehydrogenase [Oscillospiraceae bacterium]